MTARDDVRLAGGPGEAFLVAISKEFEQHPHAVAPATVAPQEVRATKVIDGGSWWHVAGGRFVWAYGVGIGLLVSSTSRIHMLQERPTRLCSPGEGPGKGDGGCDGGGGLWELNEIQDAPRPLRRTDAKRREPNPKLPALNPDETTVQTGGVWAPGRPT